MPWNILTRTILLATGLVGVLACLVTGRLVAQDAGIDPSRLPGIVVDDSQAVTEGTWTKSRHTRPFVGDSYIYSQGGAGQTVKFPVEVNEAGTYQVLVSYSPGTNRTTKAAIIVPTEDGDKTVVLDQQPRPAGPYSFQPLGEFPLSSGKFEITVSGAGSEKGVVIADSVLLLSPEGFAQFKADFEKNTPKLAANLKVDPNKPANKPAKPVAKPEDKKPEPPQETPPAFVRKAPAKPVAKLTADELDALMEKHVGGIADVSLVADEDYIRRVTLDIIGRQPTLSECDAFAADDAMDKRARLVERLLASPEFGTNWGNYYSDVISYRTPEPELTFLNYTPFKKWLADEFRANRGWDEISYQVITAVGKVGDNPAATYVGFHQGDRSRLASETTRVFLSTQIQCAECHDHKFVEMPQETFHHVAAFFVRVQAKLPWNDSSQIVVSSKPAGEHKMDGRKEEMKPIAFSEREVDLGRSDVSRRVELADWIVGPDNPWFAKAFVNRVWARTMGRGFCEPVDEIGELGDRVLPEVHTALAEHFVASQFDVKDLFRVVATSRAYQRQLRDPQDDTERKPFAVVAAGRLRGDEVFDSLAAGIALPNVTPPPTPATDAIRFPPPPKSTRDLVNEAFGFDPSSDQSNVNRTMQQAMLLMNNKQIQAQIDASPSSGTMLAKIVAAESDDTAAVTKLYQQVLARKPTPKELDIAREHMKSVGDRKTGYEDLLWSMVNSAEFLSRR
ncbi:MAG: DUF1553 domain-containing protein [Planctomycetaceae bacterium]|nr:DUF1553 domain-containing protein [Planctomycetaceae bacterium]